MLPKPSFLGPSFGEQFGDASVVEAYHYRPPYPDTILEMLCGLVVAPGVVLDAGTGTGEVARNIARRVAAVDALDPSPGMLAKGRRLPGGDHPAVCWTLGRAEDAPLRPPYGLVVTASSLHWMDWPVVLPRFRDLLAPGAVLAIVEERAQPNPWDADLQAVINRFSTNRGFRPYDLITELERRNLFHELGRQLAPPAPFRQSLAAYIESFHARNGFSRDRMDARESATFDRAVEGIVAPHLDDGLVSLAIGAEVIWGAPAPGQAPNSSSREPVTQQDPSSSP